MFKLRHLIYNSIKFEKKIKLNHIRIQNGNNLFLFHLRDTLHRFAIVFVARAVVVLMCGIPGIYIPIFTEQMSMALRNIQNSSTEFDKL